MKAKQHNSTIQPQKHLSPWMTTEQAAEYMCCNPITVRRWRTEGKGPRFVTVNRHTIRYHIDEIEGVSQIGWREAVGRRCVGSDVGVDYR